MHGGQIQQNVLMLICVDISLFVVLFLYNGYYKNEVICRASMRILVIVYLNFVQSRRVLLKYPIIFYLINRLRRLS